MIRWSKLISEYIDPNNHHKSWSWTYTSCWCCTSVVVAVFVLFAVEESTVHDEKFTSCFFQPRGMNGAKQNKDRTWRKWISITVGCKRSEEWSEVKKISPDCWAIAKQQFILGHHLTLSLKALWRQILESYFDTGLLSNLWILTFVSTWQSFLSSFPWEVNFFALCSDFPNAFFFCISCWNSQHRAAICA